jgi:hypothetical protein
MEALKTARNVAIVVLLAAAVYLLPGGGRAASTFEAILLVGFGVGFGYFGVHLYRENRIAVYSLGDRHRAFLYGGLVLIAFIVLAQKRMWQTGLGEIVWFALIALAGYALLNVYRHWRSY